MRTTTLEGRRGDADFVEELNDTLQSTRKLLADTNALLELRIEKLSEAIDNVEDNAETKALDAQLTENRKCLLQALDLRSKALNSGLGDKPMFDREAAIHEIESRLARLAT